MSLSLEDFNFISEIVRQGSGINLSKDKSYLIESRLMPVTKKFSCADLSELFNKMKSHNDAEIVTAVIEAMTTNESLFFRDIKPFEQFKSIVMPRLIEKNPTQSNFRIWSAACSTGQEPYSLAMTILENLEWSYKYKFEIIASDLSSKVLNKAISGTYSQFEVQRGMPISMLLKYFKQEGEDWIINDKVKAMVNYKKINLMENFSEVGLFDVVFCRNVLLYFETETKIKILHKISKILNPNGVLILGGSEVINTTDLFTLINNSSLYALSKGV
jgi:chemotaxis protein methyltransferase CheR